MAVDRTDLPPMEEPLAELERRLIDDYIRGHGHDPATLRTAGDADAYRILAQASTYVATRLCEVEARSHYVRDLHGGR